MTMAVRTMAMVVTTFFGSVIVAVFARPVIVAMILMRMRVIGMIIMMFCVRHNFHCLTRRTNEQQ